MLLLMVVHLPVVCQSLYRTVPGIGVYFCTLHCVSRQFRYVCHFLF